MAREDIGLSGSKVSVLAVINRIAEWKFDSIVAYLVFKEKKRGMSERQALVVRKMMNKILRMGVGMGLSLMSICL